MNENTEETPETENTQISPKHPQKLTVVGNYFPESGSYLYIEAKGKWAIPALCVVAAWLSFSALDWWWSVMLLASGISLSVLFAILDRGRPVRLKGEETVK